MSNVIEQVVHPQLVVASRSEQVEFVVVNESLFPPVDEFKDKKNLNKKINKFEITNVAKHDHG